jgi:hypothetical protein
VILQENRFKDGFRAKRKQKKPTDVVVSVQDLGNPFFVTDLREIAEPRRHAALVCLLYRALSWLISNPLQMSSTAKCGVNWMTVLWDWV